MSPPKKKQQLGIATDLTEMAMTIVVASSSQNVQARLAYRLCGYLARHKTLVASTLTGLEQPAHSLVLAITHVSCKVRRGRIVSLTFSLS